MIFQLLAEPKRSSGCMYFRLSGWKIEFRLTFVVCLMYVCLSAIAVVATSFQNNSGTSRRGTGNGGTS
jgi:hypothetical protein